MGRISVRTVVFIGLALVIGFAIGTWRAGPTMRTGTAQSAEGAITIESGDWSYGVPPRSPRMLPIIENGSAERPSEDGGSSADQG